MRTRLSQLLALTAFLVCTSANAAIINFTANLTLNQEVGANTPNPSPGVTIPLTDNSGNPRPAPFGTAVFTLDTAVPVLTVSATVFNLDFTAETGPSLLPGQTPF